MAASRRWFGLLGLVLYIPTGWLYLASGLVVPGPALAVLIVCWLVGLAGVAWAARVRPTLSMLGLPAAVVFWFLFLTAGEAVFGWTA